MRTSWIKLVQILRKSCVEFTQNLDKATEYWSKCIGDSQQKRRVDVDEARIPTCFRKRELFAIHERDIYHQKTKASYTVILAPFSIL